MHSRQINLHLVSDSTGETLMNLARAALARFEGQRVVQHRWFLVRSRLNLDRVIDGIRHEPGPILYTLAEDSLKQQLEAACDELGLRRLSILDPLVDLLEGEFGEQAKPRRAAQHVMDADYFRRIDAMHFVLEQDDGQNMSRLGSADVVLVGVSRTSKTPTCFYLANKGIKAANIPLIPGVTDLSPLEQCRCPIIGLSIDPIALLEIRKTRMKFVEASRGRYQLDQYTDAEAIRSEVLFARRLFASRGWPVIDVTRRSIEETAAAVLQHIDAWHQTVGAPTARA